MYKSTEIMNESQVKKDVYIRKNEKEPIPVNTVLSIRAVDWLWHQLRDREEDQFRCYF